MTIFMTPFEGDQATAPSTDSGFTSIDQVVEMMGVGWLTKSRRLVIYAGVAFSDYRIKI